MKRMLTREQKAWIVYGYCEANVECGSRCPIRHLCSQVDTNFASFADEDLDECLKIIAPNVLVDEPKPAATPQWISVEDKLPDRFKPVIVCREVEKGTFMAEQGYRDMKDCWRIYGCQVKSVTHWIPMPEPPEVNQHD